MSQLRAQSPENQPALVTFTDGQEVHAVTIDLLQVRSDTEALVTGSFAGVLRASALAGRNQLKSASSRITFDTANPHEPVLVLRHLHALFEALDAARVVCDEILRVLDPAERYVLPSPEVRELRLQSPLLVDVMTAGPPLLLLLFLMMRLEQIRNAHHLGSITKGQADVMAENARALRIKNDQEAFRASVERTVIVQRAVDLVRESLDLPKDVPIPEALASRADELVDRQLLPGLERLLDPDINEIRIDEEDDTSDGA